MAADSDSDSDSISRPFTINPPHHQQHPSFHEFSTYPTSLPRQPSPPPPPPPPSQQQPFNIYPGGSHSLSGIALRAACLGFVGGINLLLAFTSNYFQLSFFVFLLCLFHFFEFWTTARYNTPNAKKSSFLLTTNGSAYNAAHTAAILEAIVEVYFLPTYKLPLKPFPTYLGLLLILLGQTTRTLAMVHAGTNFNHLVQQRKRPGHVLVKNGIYSFSRHPSYFGFFWWGLGTQLLLANPVCFVIYAVVLWKFFSERIKSEERYLISFFGKEYIDYKASTRVGIPFIS